MPHLDYSGTDWFGSLDSDISDINLRRVYCNRDLNLATVHWVGFDMDYTLAIYRRDPFDALTFRLTVERLIENFGYDEALRNYEYDPEFAIRGLVIDKKTGHILKMNVFRHVGKAWHGLHEVPVEERSRYRKDIPQISSERYRLLDTLFEVPEAYIFAILVDMMDRGDMPPDYARLADDVRAAIDGIHVDGTLKSRITTDIPTYIYRDPDLASALHRLRSSGKRLFLLTNSDYNYTNALMSWLLDGRLDAYPSWKTYFDVVVTSAAKPSFFRGNQPFQRLDDRGQAVAEADSFQRGAVYSGGNLKHFERFIGLGGDEVLYVGDHIFGDILRSKLDSNWRTAMIIPEMESELESTEFTRDIALAWHHAQLRLADIEREIEIRNDAIHRLRSLQHGAESEGERKRIDRLLRPLVRRVDHLRRQIRSLLQRTFEYQKRFDESFNSRWGALFKEGNELSLFGSQVDHYACIYTSRASNLGHFSPVHYFRSRPHSMPHENLNY